MRCVRASAWSDVKEAEPSKYPHPISPSRFKAILAQKILDRAWIDVLVRSNLEGSIDDQREVMKAAIRELPE